MGMKKIICLIAGVVLAVSLTSCKNQSTESKAPAEMKKSATSLPASLKGKVVETAAGGGFSYILVDTGANKMWVTVPEVEVAVGEEIDFVMADSQMLTNFYSKTLDKTFDSLVIAAGVVGKEPKNAAGPHGPAVSQAVQSAATADQSEGGSFADALQSAPGQMPDPSQVSTGSDKAIVPFAELEIEKAVGENSYSVGELYKRSAELNGKKVMVKGQVMKVSQNIMGKNWVHLQDGTGDPATNTHDLVVTSAEIPTNGEIVTVEGTLAADKDFGFGYKYSVLIEDAVVKR